MSSFDRRVEKLKKNYLAQVKARNKALKAAEKDKKEEDDQDKKEEDDQDKKEE